MNHKIICANFLDAAKEIEDESIDTVLTSVPFYGLRNYGEETAIDWGDWHGQLGLEPTPELYIEHLRVMFKEVKRMLKSTGTCWVNLGDTYAGSGCGKGDYRNNNKRSVSNPMLYCDKPNPQLKSNLPAKSMMMIPERFAFMMLDENWILRNKICWFKPNGLPSSVQDRFNTTWEYLFFFVKNNKPVYFYNDKTGLMVDKKPKTQIEGVDWDWKDVGNNYSKNNTKIEAEDAEKYSSPRARIHREKKQKKVSHWHSLDYWFDLDAVREEHKWIDGNGKRIGSEQLGARVKANKDFFNKKGSGGNYDYGGLDSREGVHNNPSGKNPGDVVFYNSKYNIAEHGQTLQGFTREQSIAKKRHQSRIDAKFLFPDNKKKQQEYVNYVHDHLGHPLGPTPGDFWPVNTQPFPEAHFAVFPQKLCEKPILAGCPEQTCKYCGKPRMRIMKKQEIPIEEAMKDPAYLRATPNKDGEYHGKGIKDYHSAKAENPSNAKRRILQSMRTISETTGWTDCECKADDKYEPGVVLDPFAGSGTVGVVAEKLGRNSIQIDIKPEYCEMAYKRLKPLVEQTKLFASKSTIERIGF